MKITNIGSDVKVDAHRQGEQHSGTEFPGDIERVGLRLVQQLRGGMQKV